MSSRISPIGTEYKIGLFGHVTGASHVKFCQTEFEFVGELAAFPASINSIDDFMENLAAKSLDIIAFKIARDRWFLACTPDVLTIVKTNFNSDQASLIDLTHGRAALSIFGSKAVWVLSKLYALDFDMSEFPVNSGLATTHHGIFTQIYRSGDEAFHLFVFRSFARSFWHTLTRAADDVGYEVV